VRSRRFTSQRNQFNRIVSSFLVGISANLGLKNEPAIGIPAPKALSYPSPLLAQDSSGANPCVSIIDHPAAIPGEHAVRSQPPFVFPGLDRPNRQALLCARIGQTTPCHSYQRNPLTPIDTGQKPYYCVSKIQMSERSFHDASAWPCTGALCPCTAAHHRKSIDAYQHDGLGVANGKVTSK
jgi:hypothetical protein